MHTDANQRAGHLQARGHKTRATKTAMGGHGDRIDSGSQRHRDTKTDQQRHEHTEQRLRDVTQRHGDISRNGQMET